MKSVLVLLSSLVALPLWAFPMQTLDQELNRIVVKGKTPVAIFDLDETLIHSSKRSVFSYTKAIERNYALLSSQWPNETRVAYERLTYSGESLVRSMANQYDEVALFRQMNIRNLDFIQKLASLRLPIYLSNEFIYLDSAYRGAVQLLDQIYQSGGRIYFVSSRYQVAQGTETLRSLQKLNFLRDPKRSVVILRNNQEASIDFKKRAFAQIKSNCTTRDEVVLVGENEPENINAMMAQFPSAMAVFVEGAVLNQKVQILPSFKLIFTKNFIQE